MLKSSINRDYLLKLLFVAVFVFATVLRFGMAFVNREAFDDHVGVISLILQNNKLPQTEDCWECFQPKLFYFVAATAIRIAHVNPGHIHSIIIATQLMNVAAGEVLLIIVYLLIRQMQFVNRKAGLVVFALLAFNPALIAANGMASNDSFAILLSSVAIYSCWRFLREDKLSFFIVSGIFVTMGIATKTNIWGTALAIFLVLLIKAFNERRFFSAMIAGAFLIGVSAATLLNPLSQYLDNIKNYGTPVTLNVVKEPFPSFFEKTYVRRPGIVSIQDGLFTFKLIELLEYPRLSLGAIGYPAHRTSLWTDVFASANSLHFYNSPDSWHTKPDFEVSRSIFILALLPAALLLFGVISGWIFLLKGVFGNSKTVLFNRSYGLFDIVFVGYAIFIVVLALQYRDFSTMKAVYIYPAILSFVVLTLEATNAFYIFLSRQNRWITILFEGAILFLIIMYVVDISQMIVHLYNLNVR